MQDMLVPILGENGAIIAQYVITLAVILGLIVLVVWAIRHYSGGPRPAARARLPRLAIVDTLAIDSKRRLVLVRRDSVEHLVLIGGPSDVVVEPSIIRQRVAQRPGQTMPTRPQAAGAVPQAPPPPPPPAPAPQASAPAAPRVLPSRAPLADAELTETPIPFPPRRTPLRATERLGLSRRETTRNATMAASAFATPETPSEPAVARRMAMPAIEEDEQPAFAAIEPVSTRFVPPVHPFAEEPAQGPMSGHPLDSPDVRETGSAFAPSEGDREAMEPATAESNDPDEAVEGSVAPPTAAMDLPEGAAQPAEASDLEKEMARLLNEISTSRRE